MPANSLTWRRCWAQIATPGGLGLSSFWAPMLAPFTTLAVSSLADFSARARQGTPSGATREGTARQCFARLALCKVHWPDFHGMLEVGQATFAHYAASGLLPADPAGFELPATAEPAAPLLGRISVQLHARSPLVAGPAAEQQRPQRVLLEQRGGLVRNFVDLPQLLGSCNAAGDTLCRAFTFAGDYARCRPAWTVLRKVACSHAASACTSAHLPSAGRAGPCCMFTGGGTASTVLCVLPPRRSAPKGWIVMSAHNDNLHVLYCQEHCGRAQRQCAGDHTWLRQQQPDADGAWISAYRSPAFPVWHLPP